MFGRVCNIVSSFVPNYVFRLRRENDLSLTSLNTSMLDDTPISRSGYGLSQGFTTSGVQPKIIKGSGVQPKIIKGTPVD